MNLWVLFVDILQDFQRNPQRRFRCHTTDDSLEWTLKSWSPAFAFSFWSKSKSLFIFCILIEAFTTSMMNLSNREILISLLVKLVN
jgi:hypothetical protein